MIQLDLLSKLSAKSGFQCARTAYFEFSVTQTRLALDLMVRNSASRLGRVLIKREMSAFDAVDGSSTGT